MRQKRVKVVASVTQKKLGAALAECMSSEAVLNTDEHLGHQIRARWLVSLAMLQQEVASDAVASVTSITIAKNLMYFV